MRKLTTEEFIEKANQVHSNLYKYNKTKYINSRTKVIITCPIHGDFEQLANAHLQGQKCPKCMNCYRLNTLDFIEKSNKVHNNKYDYSNVIYVNMKSKVKIICPIHGEFNQVPVSHLNGCGCPKCANKHRNDWHKKSTEQFIEQAIKIHSNKYSYSKVDYKKSSDKVCIICPDHGEFWQTPHNHLSGQGCPKCQLKSQTKLYEKLKESFPDKEILFEVGNNIVPWIKNQRFDIYFPKYNIAIEYNGIQHYIPVAYFGGQLKFDEQQIYDRLKYLKCKENNYILFEIKYNYTEDDYNNLVININNIVNNYEIQNLEQRT